MALASVIFKQLRLSIVVAITVFSLLLISIPETTGAKYGSYNSYSTYRSYNNNNYYRQQQYRQNQQLANQAQQQRLMQQRQQMQLQRQQIRAKQEQQRQIVRERQQQMRQQVKLRQQEALAQRQRIAIQQKKRIGAIKQTQKSQRDGINNAHTIAIQKANQQAMVSSQQKYQARKVKLHKLANERQKRLENEKKDRNKEKNIYLASLGNLGKVNDVTQPKVNNANNLSQFKISKEQFRKQPALWEKVNKRLAATRQKMTLVNANINKYASKKVNDTKRLAQKAKQASQKKQQQKKLYARGTGCAINEGSVKSASFHGDTLVKTVNGYKPIKLIKAYEDFVWSRNEFTGEMAWQQVTDHRVSQYLHHIKIEITSADLQNHQSIFASANHPFFVSQAAANDINFATNHTGQWLEAADLAAEMKLIDESLNHLIITQIDSIEKPLTAYNLTVANFHTFFVKAGNNPNVKAIWVHNESKNDSCTRPPNNVPGIRLTYDKQAKEWISPQGLRYGIRPQKVRNKATKDKTSIQHVLLHLEKNFKGKEEKKIHTTFKVKRKHVLKLLDDAWAIKKKNNIQKDSKGGYVVNMNYEVGENGLKGIRIVTMKNQPNVVVTAYPCSLKETDKDKDIYCHK